MIEKQSINGKDVWIKVDTHPAQRSNPNIIPTEYFTATYYTQEPPSDVTNGQMLTEDNGEPQLFESPVAALSAARKQLENKI